MAMELLQSFSFADFNTVCTKAEGRDKLARFFQYAGRLIFGITNKMTPTTGSRLSEVNAHARTVMVQLAAARRTHRWCKEFPVIMGLPKSLEIANMFDRILDLLQKIPLATFMIIDHVGWLKQLKILKSGKRAGTGTIQLGLKFFCFSNFIAAIINTKKIVALQAKKETEDGKVAADTRKCMEAVFKHSLLVMQTAHLSLLYQTDDALVGFAGMITSLMDLMPHWPERKPKQIADAKMKAK
mmetsp:Transcript_67623/g.188710  ORF Transcript_67623/g.188710 Transcript_67623/m.188710 type:complete len:241 (-) Transcript_67623:73-795(-)|eukprot:CAMPEP_0117541066 /NCGR_PEP_ID=MMETSP0784-20121206/43826_1 /TAXON_ID=39447 /ORGANISM="" /LENGTH=240 /DNA_ID=CAMNT_0005337747 /DNA_START=12 /DNA_END=734 /DNA_ORIENTATION=-